jgi:Tfp pilus assembly protein PilO
MLIRDIVITESYVNELVEVVRNLLSVLIAKDIDNIQTEKFQQLLAQEGYVTTIQELIQAVDQSGYASSVDRETIVPGDELPDDMSLSTTNTGDEVDVSSMAQDQASSDISDEL